MSTTDRQLLEAMTEAVHAVGVLVRSLDLPPEPVRDREEFLRRFSAVDEPALALMRERLGPLRPGTVWADELDTRLPEHGEVWVADAVDGAVQFLQGATALVRLAHPGAGAAGGGRGAAPSVARRDLHRSVGRRRPA